MTKTTTEENSERKRISIPKVDDSVLAWWATQNDPSLSVRLLIRSEIERSGYTDIAFRPVVQQPRRGRPPGSGMDGIDERDEADQIQPPAPVAAPAVATPVREPLHAVAQVAPAAPRASKPASQEAGFSLVDDLMNG